MPWNVCWQSSKKDFSSSFGSRCSSGRASKRGPREMTIESFYPGMTPFSDTLGIEFFA